jgi:hypothetical protein
METRRSVLDALRESPLANCTVHGLPWDISPELAAFECSKGCLWSSQDKRLTVSYLDSLQALSLEPYWYTLILKEEMERLDWSIQHGRIDHALSYMASIKDLLQGLTTKITRGE